MNRGGNFLERFVLLIGLAFLGMSVWCLLRDRDIPPEPEQEQVESADHPTLWGDPRSPQWASVRRQFVESHPVCEACGSAETLNVHHVQPFHLHPELELEPSNLITLCREHHFRIGHDPDGPWKPQKPTWKAFNPQVRKHSQMMRDGR